MVPVTVVDDWVFEVDVRLDVVEVTVVLLTVVVVPVTVVDECVFEVDVRLDVVTVVDDWVFEVDV